MVLPPVSKMTFFFQQLTTDKNKRAMMLENSTNQSDATNRPQCKNAIKKERTAGTLILTRTVIKLQKVYHKTQRNSSTSSVFPLLYPSSFSPSSEYIHTDIRLCARESLSTLEASEREREPSDHRVLSSSQLERAHAHSGPLTLSPASFRRLSRP